MSFGSTLTITVNAVAKVLDRINASEPFSSLYRLRETTTQYDVLIRHSAAKPNADGVVYERHNLVLTKTIFATSTDPEFVYSASTVFTCPKQADPSVVIYTTAAAIDYLDSATVQGDLLKWLN